MFSASSFVWKSGGHLKSSVANSIRHCGCVMFSLSLCLSPDSFTPVILLAPLLLPLLPVVAPSFPFSNLYFPPFWRPSSSCSNVTPTSLGDWAGPEVRSKALVGDRQALEGSYRQAVPRTLAQPPEPGGEEDVVDRGRGPDNLPGAWETGKPLGWNCEAAPGKVRRRL